MTPISRRRLLLGAAVLAAGMLAGCAEGSRSDAERGKQDDADRESVVKSLQATETYRLVNDRGTPPSTPEGQ